MKNIIITITTILCLFTLLFTYNLENKTYKDLSNVKPVKLYTSECGTMLGVKEHYTLCEVE